MFGHYIIAFEEIVLQRHNIHFARPNVVVIIFTTVEDQIDFRVMIRCRIETRSCMNAFGSKVSSTRLSNVQLS